jgi:hypothetical protein
VVVQSSQYLARSGIVFPFAALPIIKPPFPSAIALWLLIISSLCEGHSRHPDLTDINRKANYLPIETGPRLLCVIHQECLQERYLSWSQPSRGPQQRQSQAVAIGNTTQVMQCLRPLGAKVWSCLIKPIKCSNEHYQLYFWWQQISSLHRAYAVSTTAISEPALYSLSSESCPFYSMRRVDNKGRSVCFQCGLS